MPDTRSVTDVTLSEIGGRTNDLETQWAKVSLALRVSGHGDHFQTVSVSVLLTRAPDATLAVLEDEARLQAIATLRAAADYLGQTTFADERRIEIQTADRVQQEALAELEAHFQRPE